MRGHIVSRAKGSYSLVLDRGDVIDPATGKTKRRQKWHTFRGPRKEAETQLTNLLKSVDDETYVDASTITVGAWLTEWLTAKASQGLSPRTQSNYQVVVNHVNAAPIGKLRLQKLRATHLETFYAAATQGRTTVHGWHVIIGGALKRAVKLKLVVTNVARDVESFRTDRRTRKAKAAREVTRHCWTATEAREFLDVTSEEDEETAAFYALALDSGARLSELLGLQWTKLDLDAAWEMTIDQQYCRQVDPVTRRHTTTAEPVFDPPKNGTPRTITIGAKTVALLRAHRKRQRERQLQNRTRATYRTDLDLVFADATGLPRQHRDFGKDRPYAALIKVAGLRYIKFHGIRHTSATLLLKAGVLIKTVSERLGHANITITLEHYAHVLPDMQRAAASTLDTVLYGPPPSSHDGRHEAPGSVSNPLAKRG